MLNKGFKSYKKITKIVLAICLLLSTYSVGDVPAGINYQGRYEENGTPVTGTRTFRFRIYSAPTDGLLLWDSGDVTLSLTDGLFNYVLNCSAVDWKTYDPYLEITVDGTILSPREKIQASPYAFYASSANYAYTSAIAENADKLGGNEPSYFLDTSAAAQTKTGNLTVDSLFATKSLGIGTGSPATALHVYRGTVTAIGFASDLYDVMMKPRNDFYLHVRNKADTDFKGVACYHLYISSPDAAIDGSDGGRLTIKDAVTITGGLKIGGDIIVTTVTPHITISTTVYVGGPLIGYSYFAPGSGASWGVFARRIIDDSTRFALRISTNFTIAGRVSISTTPMIPGEMLHISHGGMNGIFMDNTASGGRRWYIASSSESASEWGVGGTGLWTVSALSAIGGITIRVVEVSTVGMAVQGRIRATTKDFDIPHPLDPENRRLTHGCLEGPEYGVYYRGEAQLVNGEATVKLPDYFEALTLEKGRTIQLTPFETYSPLFVAQTIKDNKFVVRTTEGGNPSQKFYWEVKAIRKDVPQLEVERKIDKEKLKKEKEREKESG